MFGAIDCWYVPLPRIPLIASVDGKHVITVEGIGSSANPHPVQEVSILPYLTLKLTLSAENCKDAR